jgi:MarR family transcriptional regulator, lower aerobic nicotinate degradation pathway regulator
MSLSDLHRKPGHLIRRLQQIAVALFMLETGRLTPIQYASLAAIREVPDVEASRLSTLVALDRATLAKVLERLEARGWIVRRASKADRRIKLLRVTPKGRAVLKAAEPGVRRCQRKILAPLGAAERAQFMRMLERMVAINNEYSRAPMGEGGRDVPAKRRRRKSAV